MRPREEAVPWAIVDDIACDRNATFKSAEQSRAERGRKGEVGTAVLLAASLAVMDDPGLLRAYDGLAAAIKAELDQNCEDFRVGVNEMERLVTSVIAPRECNMFDWLFLTNKYCNTAGAVVPAMTRAKEAVVGMIAGLDVLVVVNRDGLLLDIIAQLVGAIRHIASWHICPCLQSRSRFFRASGFGRGTMFDGIPRCCKADRFGVLLGGTVV